MNQTDDWQRLSPLALVFLIVSGLQRQVRENLFVFAGAGAGAAFTDWLGLRELLLIVLVFVLISTLGAMIYHRRFRFRLETDAVRVRRGLIEQKELRVRFDRVQNIQLGQPFYFRPFGLVRFSLQTPGAADKEVELPGIPRSLAETMRDRISAARAAGPAATEDEDSVQAAQAPAGARVFTASAGRLFLHGLSSNQVWVIAGLVFYVGGNLLERFGDRVDQFVETAVDNAEAVVLPGPSWLMGLSVLIAFLLLLFGLSGLLALVRFWRFELFERGDRLVATAGLLDRREQTVRRNKVTGVLLRQSAVGRVLGCWSLLVRQTRSSDQEAIGGRSAFLLPGLRAGDLVLSDRLLPGLVWTREFHGISPRFRLFAWSRLLVGLVAVLVLLALVLGPGHWSLLAVAVLAALAVPALHLRFRHWGWARQERMLWVRRGLLGRRFDGFDLEKVQQARVTSSPYQRRHDLVSLELVLPQGSISLPFLPEADAAGLANLALLAAETAHAHRV
ncbi:MAG: hypothetical protein EA419_12090 [Wenzhouxiangella sp.]|nr:MAG: hypothetical protein EA419_12090 [Wenzhouxiangella sp.]